MLFARQGKKFDNDLKQVTHVKACLQLCVMYAYVLADVTSLASCLNRSAILLDICFICTNLNDDFIRFFLQYLVNLLSKESICQQC